MSRNIEPRDIRFDTWMLLSPKEDLLVRLCHNLDKRVSRMIAAALSPLGLSQTQALFIIYMSYYPDQPVYQNVLEKTFGLTNPTVTASVRSLVNKGIIFRERDANDGRYFHLHLTDKGKELYVPCVQAFLATNDTLLSKLSVEEEQQFIALYRKILK